jgi:hypothetical protein
MPKLRCVAVLLLLIMCLAAFGAEPEILVAVEKSDDTFLVDATIVIPVPLRTAWEVLTDFNNIMNNLTLSRIIRRKGSSVFVMQEGSAKFGMAIGAFPPTGSAPPTSRPSTCRNTVTGSFRSIEVRRDPGEKCYPTLSAIREPVDLVDVFRKPADTPQIAREAVAIGAKTLWLQIGVINDEAVKIAEESGLTVVMDRCVKIEYARLFGGLNWFGVIPV